jgi:putative transposase
MIISERCRAVRKRLEHVGCLPSMSRKENCWDHAFAESFIRSLKGECMQQGLFDTRHQAQIQIFRYIEGFYNRVRKHSVPGNKSPVEFEMIVSA